MTCNRTNALAAAMALALILALAGAAGAEPPLGLALHPAGLTLSVKNVERLGEDLVVGIVATNNGQHTLYLLEGRGYLEDGQGQTYPLRPPADGTRMGVPPLSRLRANLSFAGAPPLEVQRLSLVLNQGVPDGNSTATQGPFIMVEIPLPRGAYAPDPAQPGMPADPGIADPQVNEPAMPADPPLPVRESP